MAQVVGDDGGDLGVGQVVLDGVLLGAWVGHGELLAQAAAPGKW